MKSNTLKNQTSTKLMAGALAVIFAAMPFVGSAQTTERPERSNEKFCSSLGALETKIIESATERLTKAKAGYDAHMAKFETRKAEAKTRLDSARAQADAQWATRMAELEGKAKTDAHKAAIATFGTTVISLVEERRAAVNQAHQTFLAGMDNLRGDRSTDLETALKAYKAGIEAAFDTAEVSCEGGATPATVREQLRTDLSAVRDEFKQSRGDIGIRDGYKALREARVAEAKQARDTFRAGFEAAKKVLRDAFGRN